jgi:hypothetical protein
MAFNGSGTFNRLYSWVQDAANGVNIDATRMDNEFNGIATALSDCVTRDGQSPFTANIPAGGFKITGLGTPSSTGDAATYEFVNLVASNEWKAEANTVTFVSTTSFRVGGGSTLVATYHAGRRLKIVHNTGGTTTYATVVSSSFSTPNTTVVVATDAAAALVSTVTAVSYGLLSYSNPSYLDPRTAVFAYLPSNAAYTGGNITKITATIEAFDSNAEYDSITSTFTAQHPGYYVAICNVDFVQTSSAARYLRAIIYKNGGLEAEATVNDGVVAVAGGQADIAVTAFLNLAKGDTLEGYFTSLNSGTIERGFPYNTGTRFQVFRIA